jgi:hypothetical protein
MNIAKDGCLLYKYLPHVFHVQAKCSVQRIQIDQTKERHFKTLQQARKRDRYYPMANSCWRVDAEPANQQSVCDLNLENYQAVMLLKNKSNVN